MTWVSQNFEVQLKVLAGDLLVNVISIYMYLIFKTKLSEEMFPGSGTPPIVTSVKRRNYQRKMEIVQLGTEEKAHK